jgi:dipeptidyl-peptidase 4
MRKSLKITLILTFFIVFSSKTQDRYRSVADVFEKAPNLTGAAGPASVNWMQGGQSFAYKTGNNVIKNYNPAKDSEEVLFDPANFKFPGSDTPFNYANFQFTKDFRFLVFRTNIVPVWRNSGNADYYLYDIANKHLKLLAQKAYTAELSPDGTMVGFEQNGNLFVTTLATGKQKQLTFDAQKAVYNGRFGWVYEEEFVLVQGWEWSHDSKNIAFWQTNETQVPIYRYTNYTGFDENYEEVPYPRVGNKLPSVRIGIIELQTGKKTWAKVNPADGYLPRIYWTAEANKLAVVKLNRKQNHMEMYFVDIKSGNASKIFEEKSNTWVEVQSFGAGLLHMLTFPTDKKEFYWVSDRDGYSHLYLYNYKGQLIQQITKGNWDLIKVAHTDYANNKLYYTATERSPLEINLYVTNTDGSNKKLLSSQPGKHNINFGGHYYIDSWSNTNTPRQIDLYDNTGRLIKKLQANEKVSNFVKNHSYSPKTLGSFTTTDGQKIDYSLIKPFDFDSSKTYPVCMEVYGGPAHQSVFNEFGSSALHQYMAQLGYIVVQVNNRGGSGYGSAFKKIVYGKLGHYECYDFAQTAKHLASYKWIDPTRIGIKGHSYGGFTAAYSVLNYPDIYKTAIIAAPVTDWRNYDAAYTERFMGILPESEKNYNNSAVITQASKLTRKVLLTHSTADDNVHIRNTMQLASAFIDAGKDADMRIYTKGGHGIGHNSQSQQLLTQQYIDFLESNLKKQ